MSDLFVSVIMPAYNRERYVAVAIESVLAQTFPHWELIIVDDGSSDSTLAIVRRYQSMHPEHIRVISQRNSGVAVARNEGIRSARGTHIAFIDSDDTWYPAKLERQVTVAREGGNVAFIYTGYEIVDQSGRSLRTVRPDPRFEGDIYEELWVNQNEILGPTLLVERERLFAVGLFDERLCGPENLALRIKLAKRGRVRFVDDILYRYRRHDDSLTADTTAMLEQKLAMIRNCFSEPLGPPDRKVLRKVMSDYRRWEGNLHFEQMQFGKALAFYMVSLPGSRCKGEVLVRAGRCLLGRPGNELLKKLKKLALSSRPRVAP